MEEAIIFRSDLISGTQKFQLASGFISTTHILFEKEGILAVIQAEGAVEFFNSEKNRIAAAKVPAQEGGRQVYEEVCCTVGDGAIVLKFPVCQWIDNYPHCDGEYDRWDRVITGYHTLRFDLETNSAQVQN